MHETKHEKTQQTTQVEVYTDGACRGNPGPGGWGVYIISANGERELCGGEPDTTNNRMELRAAIEALRALEAGTPIVLHTDSQYVRKGITEWMSNWKRNGWRTAARKPVKNADLWRELDEISAAHKVDWRWVRGHNGDPGNERADALANRGVDAC